jgi:hypothetical protein
MSARTQLAAKLAADLDSKLFAVIDAETLPDQISKDTVIVRHQDYTPAPNALESLVASFIITLATPKLEPRAAEDDLDDRWPDVLAALRSARGLVFTKASKVIVNGKYPGIDITITIPVSITDL